MTSGPLNCDSITWYGSPIALLHNGIEVETIPTRFEDFEYCFAKDAIDVENDTLELLSGGVDGVSNKLFI